ncbi:MAG: putative manganese transporter [Candidatus Marinimicrobia bacterium]|nr:putative manganese transporter [Candidatus Neomarinimicrobiota bacterium]
MISELIPILKQSIMITGFVFVMMLVIEYINVQTNGIWQKKLSGNRWKQYIFAALLGAIPGCLGAFTVVALFSHRLVSFGAIVAAMIATSGDEAFVMLAMFPKTAILLTIIIFIVGIIAGFITDKFYFPKKLLGKLSENQLPLHPEEHCKCFEKDKFYTYLLKPSIYRIILILIIALLLIAVITGVIAGDEKMWIKISVTFVISVSLFIVATVPEHFLKEHLWEHITKVHTPRIFSWIFGTLLVFHFLMSYINIEAWITENMLYLLIIAVLVGIIPESGPHFIFITLFAQGAIPFSVLLASSISQDGHGMLPLLAESKRGFLGVKLVNIVYALIVGLIAYAIGY